MYKFVYRKANRALLLAAEEIHGSSLQRSELFLHLRCRPCKRRLKNFIALKKTDFRKSEIFRTSKGIYRGVTLHTLIAEDIQSNTTQRLAFREVRDKDLISKFVNQIQSLSQVITFGKFCGWKSYDPEIFPAETNTSIILCRRLLLSHFRSDWHLCFILYDHAFF